MARAEKHMDERLREVLGAYVERYIKQGTGISRDEALAKIEEMTGLVHRIWMAGLISIQERDKCYKVTDEAYDEVMHPEA